MKALRPVLGTLKRVLAEETRREAVDLGKAALRTVREDVREFPEHLRDVKREAKRAR
jgi:hypothetical protein